MIRKASRLAVFVFLAVSFAAPGAEREAAVRTVSGDSWKGVILPGTNGLIVRPATGDAVAVPWIQVLEVAFAAGAAVVSPSPNGQPVAAPAAGVPAVAAAPPTAWNGASVGTPVPGTIVESPEGVRVTGTGRGLQGNADACFLAERRLDGSGQMVAALESFDGQAPEAAAGVMLRDNLGESAAYAFLGQRTGSGVCFQYRQIASGMTMRVTNVALPLPAWFRLSRVGGAVLAEVSSDGRSWNAVGRVNVNLGQNVRAGMAVANGADEGQATARFLNPAVGARGLGYIASTGFPRVRLRGGSILVGPVESADDSVVRMGGVWKGAMLSVLNVARIDFAPVSPDLEGRLTEDRVGVMLSDGDFLDGSLRSVRTNTVTISSLLFGYRRFAIGSEAAVVTVGPTEDDATSFRVQLDNGSDLRVRGVTNAGDHLVVEAPLLGSLKVPLDSVTLLSRTLGER